MYFYGYFPTNFFISVRRAEAITWENLAPAKRDPTVQKSYPVLPELPV